MKISQNCGVWMFVIEKCRKFEKIKKLAESSCKELHFRDRKFSRIRQFLRKLQNVFLPVYNGKGMTPACLKIA